MSSNNGYKSRKKAIKRTKKQEKTGESVKGGVWDFSKLIERYTRQNRPLLEVES